MTVRKNLALLLKLILMLTLLTLNENVIANIIVIWIVYSRGKTKC